MNFDLAPITTAPAATSPFFEGAWHAMPTNVARSRRELVARLRDFGIGDEALESIGIAVAEATNNVVYHAYVGQQLGRFHVAATALPGEIVVSVEDAGCGFDPADDRLRLGRGLARIASLAHQVETVRLPSRGMRVTMTFRRA